MNSRRRTDLARLVFPSCQLDEVLVERQVVTDGVLISKSTTQTARLITPLSLCSKPTAGIDSARYPPRDIYPQLEKITRGYRPLDYSNTFLNEHLKSSTSPYS